MVLFCVFLIVSGLVFVTSENASLSPEQTKIIQEKLDKLQLIKDLLNAILKPEATPRDEKKEDCLPIGAECSFASGPNCCSIRTRCNVWDRLENGGTPRARWRSACREYNGGVWMDEVYQFFKNLG
ncbi:uncharacterized protein CDAR_11071 [Caerostris darwini]|uniref:Uncharacterized protein n=1 Tax=Caerostris darwini TaxID=1538125 RepID=A0AAV4VXY2_9ARAC|nr:uncharacterized protein CDAR_11071 [Caerostris darwini]